MNVVPAHQTHYSQQLGVITQYQDINCFLHVFVTINIISIWLALKACCHLRDNVFGPMIGLF